MSSLWLKWFLAALAVSLAAAVLSVGVQRARYENRLRQQIWPAVAPGVSVLSNAPGGLVPTVMLLGDSRIAQWGLPQLAHWRVVNAGAGGLTTGQIRLCAPKLLDEIHPDMVVLEAGINDLKFLGLRPETASQMVSLASSNITAIVNECAARHCQVVVLETWPPGQPSLARRLVWNATIPTAVNQLNAQLRLLNSLERAVRVVDLFSEAGLKPGTGSYRDTLHFTPETYARLTPALEKKLDAMLLPAK
ncbi:MAG: SGNH/GDSL hydrolase family protein [Verrucomicrobiota bacterium]|jgi:lysophospholipase L1-like esterase